MSETLVGINCPRCGSQLGVMANDGDQTGFRCACGGNVRQLGLALVCCDCDAEVVIFECCDERGSP